MPDITNNSIDEQEHNIPINGSRQNTGCFANLHNSICTSKTTTVGTTIIGIAIDHFNNIMSNIP